MGMLETAMRSFGTSMDTVKVALRSGSSQQGNRSRASAGSEVGRSVRPRPPGPPLAGIGGHEVGRERRARSIGTSVVHGEEALSGTAYRAVILDVETVLPGGDDARKGERGTPERFVEADTGVGPTIEGGMVEG